MNVNFKLYTRIESNARVTKTLCNCVTHKPVNKRSEQMARAVVRMNKSIIKENRCKNVLKIV